MASRIYINKIISFLIIFLLISISANATNNVTKEDFSGLGFGIGLSLTVDSQHDRIEEAVLDENRIVRVTNTNNDIPRIMLESHYFLNIKDKLGIGPFVALQPGSNEIIEAIGMGLMLGLKRTKNHDNGYDKKRTSLKVLVYKIFGSTFLSGLNQIKKHWE